MAEVFLFSDQLRGLPLDLFQQLEVFPVQGTPELDAVFQEGSHQEQSRVAESPPSPCSCTAFGAAQDTAVGFLGWEWMLLAHVQFSIQ